MSILIKVCKDPRGSEGITEQSDVVVIHPAGARGYVLLAKLRCISIENYEKITKYLIFS
jgi:hypothetical protein